MVKKGTHMMASQELFTLMKLREQMEQTSKETLKDFFSTLIMTEFKDLVIAGLFRQLYQSMPNNPNIAKINTILTSLQTNKHNDNRSNERPDVMLEQVIKYLQIKDIRLSFNRTCRQWFAIGMNSKSYAYVQFQNDNIKSILNKNKEKYYFGHLLKNIKHIDDHVATPSFQINCLPDVESIEFGSLLLAKLYQLQIYKRQTLFTLYTKLKHVAFRQVSYDDLYKQRSFWDWQTCTHTLQTIGFYQCNWDHIFDFTGRDQVDILSHLILQSDEYKSEIKSITFSWCTGAFFDDVGDINYHIQSTMSKNIMVNSLNALESLTLHGLVSDECVFQYIAVHLLNHKASQIISLHLSESIDFLNQWHFMQNAFRITNKSNSQAIPVNLRELCLRDNFDLLSTTIDHDHFPRLKHLCMKDCIGNCLARNIFTKQMQCNLSGLIQNTLESLVLQFMQNAELKDHTSIATILDALINILNATNRNKHTQRSQFIFKISFCLDFTQDQMYCQSIQTWNSVIQKLMLIFVATQSFFQNVLLGVQFILVPQWNMACNKKQLMMIFHQIQQQHTFLKNNSAYVVDCNIESNETKLLFAIVWKNKNTGQMNAMCSQCNSEPYFQYQCVNCAPYPWTHS